MSTGLRSAAPVITILGGGAFTPRLCDALGRAIPLHEVELRLLARRTDRLKVIADHSARRLAKIRSRWRVTAAPSLEAGLAGASIVVLLVRVGGLQARAWDELFPASFGLVGDEGLGPGGIANAWRTAPELLRIARTIADVAPDARVVNLMAPLGITTRLLLEQGLDAFGVCELPLLTFEQWLARAGAEPRSTSWHYAGLNHLGWFWDVRADGKDVLRHVAGMPVANGYRAPIDMRTLERFAAAPLRYFYEVYDRDAGERVSISRQSGRAAELLELADTLVQRFADSPGAVIPEEDARTTPWLDRAVAPIVSALLDGPACSGFVNIRNGDTIPELPSELVVEVAATFTARGITPREPGPLPIPVARFLRRVGESETLAFWGARQRDPRLIARAIETLPLPIPRGAVSELASLAQQAS